MDFLTFHGNLQCPTITMLFCHSFVIQESMNQIQKTPRSTISRKKKKPQRGVAIREQKNKSGTVSLRLDYTHNGKRHRDTLNIILTGDSSKDKELKDMAEIIRAKKQYELLAEKNELPRPKSNGADFLQYFEELSRTRKKNNVWNNAVKHLRTFCKGVPLPMRAITVDMVERWKSYLLNTVSRNSASTYYNAFRTAINTAFRSELIASNPCAKTPAISERETDVEYLTIEEQKAMESIEYSTQAIQRAFLFACCTGLRLSDVSALTWNDIERGKKEKQIQVRQKKTDGTVLVFLAQKTLHYIGKKPKQAKETDRVFPISSSYAVISKHVKRMAEQAGIKKRVTFHVSRHTFATSLLTQGASLYAVSKLLGHKSIKETERYAKLINAKLEEVAFLVDSF